MNRPQKKKEDFSLGRRDLIHNQCMDEWEKFLPDEEELLKIIWRQNKISLSNSELNILAKAISKRLRGE
jgi:hypothetical protein